MDEQQHIYIDQRPSCSTGSPFQVCSQDVAGQGLFEVTRANVCAPSISAAYDRCLPDRLERSTTTPLSVWLLASFLHRLANPLAGTDGGHALSATLRSAAARQPCPGDVGQHHHGLMSLTPRLLPFRNYDVPDPGYIGVLPTSLHYTGPQTSQRELECLRRPRIPHWSNCHRMVSGPFNLPVALRPGWSVSSGPVCTRDNAQLQEFVSPFPDPLAVGINALLPALERLDINLPVPSGQGAAQGSVLPMPIQRAGHPSRPLFCSIRMVSVPPPEGSGPSPSSGIPLLVAAHQGRQGAALQPLGLQASRVATMRMGLIKSGLDTGTVDMLLLAHKDSTTSQYQGVWEKFMAFLSRKRLSVSDMSVGVVCNFLHYQASVMGRKYRTLSNYRSALRLPLIYACNIDVKCLTSDLFLRGAYNFRPQSRPSPCRSGH
ncbi:unnamed protein product [Meganyctiphanes norvegica]|uniref:Uncharacterized protein n=1 Tax=Meganyctiphanes norvegica TaxID=48144 RepID=A0AAV2PL34_MEGNR